VGKLPAAGLGACDFVSGCAHKFGGPQGVGFLKAPAKFRPLIVGGPQEEGRRAGTENVAGLLAMLAALEERENALQQGSVAVERMQWRDAFEAELQTALPGVAIVGKGVERLWNTVAAVMPKVADCRQRWVVKMDKLGFAVSTGSACASGKEETSHVLAAMQVSAEAASRVLRFSSGWETGREDWSRLLDGLRRAHTELAG
jgi:cysteine desulfurase